MFNIFKLYRRLKSLPTDEELKQLYDDLAHIQFESGRVVTCHVSRFHRIYATLEKLKGNPNGNK